MARKAKGNKPNQKGALEEWTSIYQVHVPDGEKCGVAFFEWKLSKSLVRNSDEVQWLEQWITFFEFSRGFGNAQYKQIHRKSGLR